MSLGICRNQKVRSCFEILIGRFVKLWTFLTQDFFLSVHHFNFKYCYLVRLSPKTSFSVSSKRSPQNFHGIRNFQKLFKSFNSDGKPFQKWASYDRIQSRNSQDIQKKVIFCKVRFNQTRCALPNIHFFGLNTVVELLNKALILCIYCYEFGNSSCHPKNM